MKLFDKISGTASQNISDFMLNFIDHTEEAFTWSERAQAPSITGSSGSTQNTSPSWTWEDPVLSSLDRIT